MASWDIFDEFERMHEELNRTLGNLYGRGTKLLPGKEVARTPVTNINETDREVIATFEIPGAKKEEISLNVTDDGIEVKAEHKDEKEVQDKKSYRYSSVSRSFYRRLPLPTNVKPDAASAEYKDGVLKVVMPKAQIEQKQKKIEIK